MICHKMPSYYCHITGQNGGFAKFIGKIGSIRVDGRGDSKQYTSLWHIHTTPKLDMCMWVVLKWWWACSSHTLVYPIIFTFPLLSLHCWSTMMHPCWCDHMCEPPCMTLTFTSLDQPCLFDGQMLYDSHVLFLFLVTQCAPSCGPTNHESLHHVVRHLL